jgi:Fic family protein
MPGHHEQDHRRDQTGSPPGSRCGDVASTSCLTGTGAGTALGRLDGVAPTLPNPELFVAMYVRREAVLSFQIEGTQSTLDDVLAFEIDSDRSKLPGDIEEVVN